MHCTYQIRILLVFVFVLCRINHAFGQCSTPTAISNGVATAGTYAVGSTAIYTCATNYVLTDTVVTCITSGGVDQWTTQLPSCVCNADACKDLPVWGIAILAVLGALLLIAIIALLLLPCCCCKGCPCYCFGASEDSQLKHHHYDDRIHNAKENGYHNKETNKVETENNQHAPNDVHVINNQANNNNEDNVEYYYDTDRAVYINPHNGTQYYKSPDKGRYLGRFSSKGAPNNDTFIVDDKRPPTSNKVRPSTRNQFSSPSQVLVVDSPRNTKPKPQMLFVDKPTTKNTQLPPKYVVIGNTPKTNTTQPQFVVVNDRTRPKTPPQPQVMVVNQKPDHEHKQPQYVVVNNSSAKPATTKPHYVVVNDQYPKSAQDDLPIVYLNQRGDRSPQRRRVNTMPKRKRTTRPYATDNDFDTDDYEPSEYYGSEPDVSRQKHTPNVRYKFQSAIERVLGSNKFRKPVHSKAPINPWMPHANSVRNEGGPKYTSTK